MRTANIDADFAAFDSANPKVWELFKLFTLEAIRSGRKHFSADAVCHRIRWYTAIETRGDIYKINDHFASRYARRFHLHYPEHDGFFAVRALREERAKVAA